ncbi:hypothetical protein AB0N61_10295 [Microbacterium sp. NPDC089320]|uniref:hypothetical protein n=1 Tax=Microbacterium sp. NPDC089320 TaxID=3155182 RepID=UPI00143BDA99
MSDPQAAPDENAEIDATGVDADFVTNDPDPEVDSATPGESQKADGDNADHPDELEVGDLP